MRTEWNGKVALITGVTGQDGAYVGYCCAATSAFGFIPVHS